MVVGAH